MNKGEFAKILQKVEKEDEIFSKKATFDTSIYSGQIIGREKQVEELVRYLVSYKRGFVVPLVSVYGRSGSGKSTITKFVCENFDEVTHGIVNLRKAKTIFGAANHIISALDGVVSKSAEGLDVSMNRIGELIENTIVQNDAKLFVLVLDEVDSIFGDKRGNPSDFFYKLIILYENLRKKGYLLCIITISNNLFSDNDLDDRVRSRIGTSEIFFEPYSKDMVKKILRKISGKSFAKKIDDKVLERCAELSSEEHGDARRAVELLRISAEIAAKSSENLSVAHVELASGKLAEHHLKKYLSNFTIHQKYIYLAIGKVTYLFNESWHSTSAIVKIYYRFIKKTVEPLRYRRISEILRELEQDGLLISQSISKGRYGFGKSYKLTISPDYLLSLFPEDTTDWKEIREKVLDYKLNPHSIGRNKNIKFKNAKDMLIWKGLI